MLGLPFIVVCGDKFDYPNVVYRERKGKWDAINFGASYIPKSANLVILNDVDTKIYNLSHAIGHVTEGKDMIYCYPRISGGPQVKFSKILNTLRNELNLHVASSGELMIIKKNVFKKLLPIPPCIAEDTYLLFRALEFGYRVHFCTKTYVTTKRTSDALQEEAYKKRTTLGIYQALQYTRPSALIRAFYFVLPILSLLLLVAGRNGRAWAKGIHQAIVCRILKINPTKF